MATFSNTQINIRTDSASAWNTNNPTLGVSEITFDRTNNEFRIGNNNRWAAATEVIKNNSTVQTLANDIDELESTVLNHTSQILTATTTANAANGRAATAIQEAATAQGYVDLLYKSTIPMTKDFLNEQLTSSNSKNDELTNLVDAIDAGSGFTGLTRIPDAVPVDVLFILVQAILSELGGTGSIKNVLTDFKTMWAQYANDASTNTDFTEIQSRHSAL